MFEGEVKIKVTDRGYVFHDITKIKGLPASGQTEINSAAASGNPPVDIVSKKYTSVNTSISENSENDTKNNSIAGR